MSHRKLLLAGSLLAGVFPAATAWAETDEVIVTARKREESLAEVPLAISAYSTEDFEKRNITSLQDIAAFTPGFAFESYSGGIAPAPVIRGLSQTALQSRIQNVGIFIDGVYIQQQTNVDFGLLGIERVEVVKGPQSALYGRNSFAGAINYVTRRPSDVLEADIAITRGTDEREDLSVSLSGPIIEGILSARVNVGTTEFDGTWRNNFRAVREGTGQVFEDRAISFLGGRGTDGNLGGYDNKSESASFHFTPTDQLEFNLGVYKFELRREDGASAPLEQTTDLDAIGQLNCNPRAPSNTNFLWCGQLEADADQLARDPRGIGTYSDSRIWIFDAAYHFTDNLTAKYIYGRTHLDAYSAGIGSGPSVIQAAGTTSMREQPVTDLEADSHELRVEWQSDRLTVLGGFYYTEVEDSSLFTSYNVQTLVSGGNIVPGPGPFAGDGIFVIADELFEDEIWSVFGAVDYRLTDTLTLGVEARFTKEKKSFVDNRSDFSDKDTFEYFSPRVSLDWQQSENALFYASIAQGEKAGGFNSTTADPGFETYDEETNITYEIGSKLSLLGGTLRLNTSVYYIDWDDLQISFVDVVPTDPESPALEPSYIGNGKGAESYGFELDATWAITDHLTAQLAYSWTHAEYANGVYDASLGSTCNPDICPLIEIPVEGTDLVQIATDISGNDLSRSPEHQAAFGLQYTRELPGTGLYYVARGDVTYQDEMYVEPLNLAYVEDRTLVNGTLILAANDDRWKLSLWAKNIFDEEYISNAIVTGSPRRYITNFGDGRTVGLTLNVALGGT